MDFYSSDDINLLVTCYMKIRMEKPQTVFSKSLRVSEVQAVFRGDNRRLLLRYSGGNIVEGRASIHTTHGILKIGVTDEDVFIQFSPRTATLSGSVKLVFGDVIKQIVSIQRPVSLGNTLLEFDGLIDRFIPSLGVTLRRQIGRFNISATWGRTLGLAVKRGGEFADFGVRMVGDCLYPSLRLHANQWMLKGTIEVERLQISNLRLTLGTNQNGIAFRLTGQTDRKGSFDQLDASVTVHQINRLLIHDIQVQSSIQADGSISGIIGASFWKLGPSRIKFKHTPQQGLECAFRVCIYDTLQ